VTFANIGFYRMGAGALFANGKLTRKKGQARHRNVRTKCRPGARKIMAITARKTGTGKREERQKTKKGMDEIVNCRVRKADQP